MKTSRIFIGLTCLSLLWHLNINGQADWNTLGNNIGGTNFFGTTNNDDIRFRVNNQQRMRLMSGTGALALGINFTPDAHLHANLLSYATNDGRLFRTDGSDTQTLTWRMFSGANVASSTLKAQFLLSPNTPTQTNARLTGMINGSANHLVIESRMGDVVFSAAGANSINGPSGILSERFRITSAVYDDPHIGGTNESITRVAIPTRAGSNLTEPLAMLHIGDRWWNQLGGHRTWMNTGTYSQRGSDNAFFGLRAREGSTDADANDAIIGWGDNDTPANRLDALRFVFCGPFNAGAIAGTGAHLNGLESMRIHPDGTIGMGDFSVNGLNQTPTQKLDIDGNVRIRQMPLTENPDVFIVGTQADAVTGDYILRYVPFAGIGNDCRWKDQPSLSVPGEQDLFIGNSFDEGCYRQNIRIGTPGGKAKVSITARSERDNVDTGLEVGMNDSQPGFAPPANGNYVTGIEVTSTGVNTYLNYIGTRSIARNGRHSVGVWAEAAQSGSYSIGVHAKATGAGSGARNIAVYGEVPNTTDFALGMVGASWGTVPTITLSDESLKTEIQDMENAIEMLMAFQPKTYYHQQPANRSLALGEGIQYGFLAQEVMEFAPELVKEVQIPELSDSTGFIEGTSLNLLGVQYESIIPLLVAGFQEIVTQQAAGLAVQEGTIAAQNEVIADLEATVTDQAAEIEAMKSQMGQLISSVAAMQQKTQNCCQNQNTETGSLINQAIEKKQMELGQNVPNPFDQSTRIDFTLPSEAQVILEISDAQGRPIRKLIDGQMSQGQHSFTFDGSGLASGIYYYTIYANGELLTKRMMKF